MSPKSASSSGVVTPESDLALAEEVAKYYADPLGFVLAMYPWGEAGGPLAGLKGPDKWQWKFLDDLGIEIRKNGFDGSHPTKPIRRAVSSGHGTGKLQGYSSEVFTPEGPRKWGEIHTGDLLFGGVGAPTRVIARHEQGVQAIFKVAFDDGSSALVGESHLWNVRGRQERRAKIKGWRTLTTGQIAEIGVKRANGVSMARQWEIPIQGPAQFEAREIDIHPYLVGIWLGDGTKGQPAYTKPYPELRQRLRSLGYEISVAADGRHNRILGCADLFHSGVFLLGSHERYIPDEYKFNTVANRIELLRGLLDSDGEAINSGSISYASTSRRLIDDVIWLVRSLGGKAMLQDAIKHGWYPHPETGERVECRDCWRVTINLDWNPFTLKHRKSAYKPSEHRYLVRWIDSIDYSHDEEAMCVTVEAKDGLYQTSDFIVTHNSTLSSWLVDWVMSTRPHARGTVTANSFTQLETKTWAAIKTWTERCLTAHWFKVNTNMMYHVDHKNSWFCAPQSSKEENSESFAGQHAADSTSFYILDESSSIPDKILEVAEGGLTDGEPMIFMFGNPTRSHGQFHRACFGSDRDVWNPTIVDSRESSFTNKAQIQEWVDKKGENSDFVRVRVRGLPPSASDLQFIGSEEVYTAQARPIVLIGDEPLIAGLDLARGGGDENVLRFRRGADARSIPPIRIPGEESRDSMRLVTVVADVLDREYDGQRIHTLFIDATGGSVGGPIGDRLRQLGHKNVVDVGFANKSPDPKCANMRAYMWAKMREWLQKIGCIDKSTDLEIDLTGPGYESDKQDRLVLESKEEMKGRGLDSPDDADALCLTWAAPVGIPKKPKKPSGSNNSGSWGWS